MGARERFLVVSAMTASTAASERLSLPFFASSQSAIANGSA
jgi:hypothetical protein